MIPDPEPFAAPPSPPSCEAAFRKIAQDCARACDAALADFLESDAPSGPHKARVALRRLTTALDSFAPILRKSEVGRLRRKAKWLFRGLGAVRDSDILTLHAKRRKQRKRLVLRNQALRHETRKRFRKKGAVGFSAILLAAAQAEGRLYRRSAEGRALRESPLPAFAATALDSAWAACLAYRAPLADMPPDTLHDFRKAMKSLRYQTEFFAPALPAIRQSGFRADLRDIQDALGTLTDHAMARRMTGSPPTAAPSPDETRALATATRLWAALRGSAPPWHGLPPG